LWLIVGLGNPGPEYRGTRHNVGFLVVDELASRGGTKVRKTKMGALYASEWLGQEEVALLKPQTYMNRSGLAVASWVRALQLSPSKLIVIHDDLDLSPFRIRIRKDGSHGGHRGVFSIVREVGTKDFIRIRIGIGRPAEGKSSVDYVLQTFSPDERASLGDVIQRAADAVQALIDQGLDAAMNCFNSKNERKGRSDLALGEEDAKIL
jgi:peptidyl-tRNA hydrolase, PTH1 family